MAEAREGARSKQFDDQCRRGRAGGARPVPGD